jgi:hypothetical protein
VGHHFVLVLDLNAETPEEFDQLFRDVKRGLPDKDYGWRLQVTAFAEDAADRLQHLAGFVSDTVR